MLYLCVLCFKLEALRFHSLNATNMEEFDKSSIIKYKYKRLFNKSLTIFFLNLDQHDSEVNYLTFWV